MMIDGEVMCWNVQFGKLAKNHRIEKKIVTQYENIVAICSVLGQYERRYRIDKQPWVLENSKNSKYKSSQKVANLNDSLIHD